MGSIVLPHLQTAWHVDQAILSEEERLVVIRFGRDHDPDCKYHLDPLPRSRTNRFP
jgi:DIM1 family U5 snRNP protein